MEEKRLLSFLNPGETEAELPVYRRWREGLMRPILNIGLVFGFIAVVAGILTGQSITHNPYFYWCIPQLGDHRICPYAILAARRNFSAGRLRLGAERITFLWHRRRRHFLFLRSNCLDNTVIRSSWRNNCGCSYTDNVWGYGLAEFYR